jgi:phage gpG-like protein
MIPAGFPTITFDPKFFRDIAALQAAIDLLGRKFQDFSEPLEAALELVIMPSIATNFKVGGRPTWKALSEPYRNYRRPGPILIQTGSMFEATQAISNWSVSQTSLELEGLGTAPYAPYHQAGTRKMPARPFVMYQPEDVEHIVQIFEIWVDGIIDQHWSN